MRYDIAVIGNDEAVFEMLRLASSAGQRSIAILPEERHSSWIIGQALRRLVSQLLVDRSTTRQRLLIRNGTPRLLHRLLTNSLTAELTEQMLVLERIGVDLLLGEAHLQSRNAVCVTSGMDCRRTVVQANNLVIGMGIRRTSMHRPLGLLPFLRPELLLAGSHLPATLCVLGGDDVGTGLAALFSLFGVDTQLLARNDGCSAMLELAHAAGVSIGHHPADLGCDEHNLFSSDAKSIVDCRRAIGFTNHLGLPEIGVEPDEHGQLWCADNLETWCTGVFGIGTVVGFSSDISKNPADQAHRILNRTLHRIRRPHFLRTPAGNYSFA